MVKRIGLEVLLHTARDLAGCQMEKVKGFLAFPGTFQGRLGREHVFPSVGKGMGGFLFLLAKLTMNKKE